MADPIDLIITYAGLDALVDAQAGNTDRILVSEVGLSETAFDASPSLENLPGEFKRVTSFAGQAVAENVIHMTANDSSEAVYDLRGIGLFLDDGTLFAAYAQPDPIFRKVSVADFLFAFDVRFTADIAQGIQFGDATFLYPPASETVKGVAEIATQDETDAGVDDERIVTPLKLKTLLDAALAAITAAVNASIGALTGRTITGAGLATGGGDLSADRVITVTGANGADIAAGTETGKAVTPSAIAAVPQTFGPSCSILGLGGAIIKTGTVTASYPGSGSHTFPVAFPNDCRRVLLTPLGNPDDGDEKDEPHWVSSMSATGFSVATAGDGSGITFAFLAIGN